jgi:hypothetical protein
MDTTRTVRNVLVGFAVVLVASACAGRSERADSGERRGNRGDAASVSYRENVVRAETNIEQAERAGGYEYAGADLTRAKEKLTAARKASDEGETAEAERLVIEAGLDAELASATVRNQEAQKSATELRDSLRSLEGEVQRNEDRSGSRP